MSSGVPCAFGLLLVLATISGATAQAPAPAKAAAPSQAAAGRVDVDVLKGTWVRPDGGYVIAIKSIGPSGALEATYFNPRELPFAKAQALPEGASLRAIFELQAGGYGGSRYELSYDPASDRLTGTFYQAVAKQKFAVYFVRK